MDVNIVWKICQDLSISTIKNLCITCKDYFRSFNNDMFWTNLLKRDFGEHFSVASHPKGYLRDLYRDLYTKGAFLHIYIIEDLARGDVVKKLRCLTSVGKPLNIEVHVTRGRISDRSVKRIPFSENTYCSRFNAMDEVEAKNSHTFCNKNWILVVHDGTMSI